MKPNHSPSITRQVPIANKQTHRSTLIRQTSQETLTRTHLGTITLTMKPDQKYAKKHHLLLHIVNKGVSTNIGRALIYHNETKLSILKERGRTI